MDNILDIINNRISCRSFVEKEIPDKVLNELLDVACKTANAGGYQAYTIIKVTNEEKKKKLCEISRGLKFIERAPVSLIFCVDFRRIKRICEAIKAPFNVANKFDNFWCGIIDTIVSAQTLCLAAESYGLKSIYIGNIIETLDQTSELLNIPDYVCPTIMVTLGYPKSELKKSPKKYNRDVIVQEEEYRDMDLSKLLDKYNEKNNDWKMKPSKKIVDRIYKTSLELHGEEFADKCLEYINEKQVVSPHHYWFGYYYLADEDFLNFEGYMKFLYEKGFKFE